MSMRAVVLGGALMIAAGGLAAGSGFVRDGVGMAVKAFGDRPAQPGGAARVRLLPEFFAAEIGYPPADVTLVHFRDTATLEIYARSGNDGWRRVLAYPSTTTTIRDGVHEVRTLEVTGARSDRLAVALDSGATGTLGASSRAVADLAMLEAESGSTRFRLIVAPADFRMIPQSGEPTPLASSLRAELATLPVPEAPQPRSIRRALPKLERVRELPAATRDPLPEPIPCDSEVL